MFGKSCYVFIAKTVNITHTTTPPQTPTQTHNHIETNIKPKNFILTNARVEIIETLTILMKTNLRISNKF